MTLRRKKSRKSQAADLLGNYLKIEAAGKAAKGCLLYTSDAADE